MILVLEGQLGNVPSSLIMSLSSDELMLGTRSIGIQGASILESVVASRRYGCESKRFRAASAENALTDPFFGVAHEGGQQERSYTLATSGLPKLMGFPRAIEWSFGTCAIDAFVLRHLNMAK